jgi:hypothetical protein
MDTKFEGQTHPCVVPLGTTHSNCLGKLAPFLFLNGYIYNLFISCFLVGQYYVIFFHPKVLHSSQASSCYYTMKFSSKVQMCIGIVVL